MSAFNISCIANWDMVRVEIVLAKGERELNKSAFDYLVSNRNAIETALGEKLVWNRYDEGKASYIHVAKGGVSIANENDWKQMGEFHAAWAKKFYDVIIPYLRIWNETI